MKMKIRIAKFLLFASFLAPVTSGQTRLKDEKMLRGLEQEQVELLLKGEVEEMAKKWLPEFTVNNPFGDVVNGNAGPIRSRRLAYAAFARNIEKIVFRDDIAIVMGSETVVPSSPFQGAGKEIKRRFTNFWIRLDGKWKMLARHANVVCDNSGAK
jgi:hypothetical protein